MREEDQSRGDTQDQRGQVSSDIPHGPSSEMTAERTAGLAERVIGPVFLFVSFYVATLILLSWLRFPFQQWTGLISAAVASVLAIAILDRGRWDLGLFVPPKLAIRELLIGTVWGIALIGTAAVVVLITTEVRHGPGRGFPWAEIAAVFLPAAIHEELVFRGYPFQKLARVNRTFAVVFVALLFAALHANNSSVTLLGLLNIFLGGVLLGVAYLRYGRLWFPIGLHLAWNLMTGPILGHEVSGYQGYETVLTESGQGPWWLSGGEFGIEGSVVMTVVELLAIGLLTRRISSARPTFGTQAVN